MDKEFYTIINKDKSAEIRIYGEIWSYGEGSSRNLSNKLRELAKTNTHITIRVNSAGGSVMEAVAIYNIIENTDAHVTMIVEGIAASAMSFILMAADKVKMGKATQLMLHKFSGGVWGSAKNMRDTADQMDKWEKDIYPLYAEKTGMKVKEVEKEFFQEGKDIWLTPKEALNYGLVDEIVEGTVKKSPNKGVKDVNNLYNHYQTHIDNHYKPKEKPMNKEHLSLLGLPEDATEEQITAKLNELKAKKEATPAPATPTPAEPKNEADPILSKEVQELKQERVNNLINPAIAAGKFTIEKKASFEKLAFTDFAGAKEIIDAMPSRERIPNFSDGTSTQNEDRSKWTMKDYLKVEGAVDKLAKEDPKRYAELVKNEYGTDINQK